MGTAIWIVFTGSEVANPLSDEAVRAAAARVGADRVITRLPAGYGQILGERGASISVGERQLLSFARAIYVASMRRSSR